MSFLSNVSERLANALPTDSLSVVVQFVAALSIATPTEGSLYIHLIRPWLHNLSILANTPREEREQVQIKLQRLIRQLLLVSTREPAVSFLSGSTTEL